MRNRKTRSGHGFTLIEVVMAIAIIAFALTAILGLVGLAVQGTKDADLYERLAMIQRRVISMYQSQAFSTLTGTNGILSGSATVTTYYDYRGIPTVITTTSGTQSNPATTTSGTYFRCDVKNATPASPAPILSATTNAALLQVQIRWPYPQLTGTDESVISILNYR